MLVGQDIGPLLAGSPEGLDMTIQNIGRNLPIYLENIATIAKEFGNAAFGNGSEVEQQMVGLWTGTCI